MEKRYQVFVSSTFWDLEEARQEVMQALLEQDCMPSGMELFPATNEDQWSLIKKVIDDSDYYIVVLAGRYGSVGPTGQSYTEMEYRYALDTGKLILGFVHRNIGELPAKFSETSTENKEKLANFHELVKQKHCKFWENPAELGGQVSRGLIKLTKSHPAIGWVRGNLVPNESATEEILNLRRRVDELELENRSIKTSEPEGAKYLEQGSDKYRIRYTYFAYGVPNGKSGNSYGEVELTWNYIHALLSPLMIDEASDVALKHTLSEAIESLMIENLSKNERPERIMNFEVSDSDYQTIKIQLRALGYITKSSKARSVKDTATYWTLTPYGDTVMTRLRAKRKYDDLI
ncbi:DUF4062 domain-containing protein [Pseudomonas lactis]|uniref:DUF4062 domain-containing protein n=1 Tax=Pseudomonas lactis TaxID=1615674 RepID=UPI00147414D6|nr:DUF4062 domain-containing protein [Pseudomonas lactis]NNA50202.1 DUF4062 domain-containing protein [Pseudomonas lactis]